jgi:hypothetical protein
MSWGMTQCGVNVIDVMKCHFTIDTMDVFIVAGQKSLDEDPPHIHTALRMTVL